jgi:hypothetical protein
MKPSTAACTSQPTSAAMARCFADADARKGVTPAQADSGPPMPVYDYQRWCRSTVSEGGAIPSASRMLNGIATPPASPGKGSQRRHAISASSKCKATTRAASRGTMPPPTQISTGACNGST